MVVAIMVWREFKVPSKVTAGVGGVAEMQSALGQLIAIGTPTAEAQRVLEREGFSVTSYTNEPFLDREHLNFLFATRMDGSGFVKRKWMIAVIVRNGKTEDILIKEGLVGP